MPGRVENQQIFVAGVTGTLTQGDAGNKRAGGDGLAEGADDRLRRIRRRRDGGRRYRCAWVNGCHGA
ncbi:protein of unknown function [Nitrospira defluvii]|uniref:Uncharacterized protein n=1 Tax=Nitrospira defluvii TaxID=330214 RepID=D8PA30_9BACT|nr:protein of unknown function [Nitrospira defluvii]